MSCHWWQEMLRHASYDEFWKRGSYSNDQQLTVPALNETGWWDPNFPGATENFEQMAEGAATEEARRGQKFVIGQRPHRVNQPPAP